MKEKSSLSVMQKLLLAANDLVNGGKETFSAEDLVVSAWTKFPDTFGMAGYRDERGKILYPDSNRVFAEIMGSKPIRLKGFLKKVGSKMYSLTDAGRIEANQLTIKMQNNTSQKASLAREVETSLRRLLASKAVEKFRNNRSSDITFYDACSFWGISPASASIEMEGQISNFLSVVNAAKDISVKKTRVVFDHGGEGFGYDDIEILTSVHKALVEKFKEELELISKRRDQRKR